MRLALFVRICCLSFGLLGIGSQLLQAQTNTWDTPKEKTKKAKKKVESGRKKIKTWKDHIKNWGLDENYNYHFSAGGKLNSNGWSGCMYYLTKIDKTTCEVWHLGFSEIKHEKQIKILSQNNAFPQLGKPTEYQFGKINNLYTLQIGYGREKLLLPGVVQGNMSVSYRYMGGFSLAMLKPYYLKLLYLDYSQTEPVAELREQAYSNTNAETFLKEGNIFGAGKWKKGLDEIKPVPGAFVELAVVITPAPDKGLVQTITLGANGAFYAKPLSIMAELKAQRWQACLFVGLSLGKKWK